MINEQKLSKVWHILNRKHMALDTTKNRKLNFRVLVFGSLLLTVIVINEAFAAQCLKYRDTYWSESNQANVIWFTDDAGVIESCTDSVYLNASEYATLKAQADLMSGVTEITALDIGEAFTWGFGTYMLFWWFGYVIKNARMVIRKA